MIWALVILYLIGAAWHFTWENETGFMLGLNPLWVAIRSVFWPLVAIVSFLYLAVIALLNWID